MIITQSVSTRKYQAIRIIFGTSVECITKKALTPLEQERTNTDLKTPIAKGNPPEKTSNGDSMVSKGKEHSIK